MSENLAPTQQIDAVSEIKESSVAPVEEVSEKKEAESVKDADFKFFKCCSASHFCYKRLSLHRISRYCSYSLCSLPGS